MRRKKQAPPFDIAVEWLNIAQVWLRHGVLGVPVTFLKGVGGSESVSPQTLQANVLREIGQRFMQAVSALGPVYGKAVQVACSRLNLEQLPLFQSLHLGDIYGNWPALPFSEIEKILDEDIPDWRLFLSVDRIPIGCASIAQVHAASDNEGRKWIIKVVRPDSEKRLHESVNAILAILDLCRPFAVTMTQKRAIREISGLCHGFRRELDLGEERATIMRMHEKLSDRKKAVLRIPAVHPELAGKKTLVVELFEGVKLTDIVEGRVTLSPAVRQKLARKMLRELLVQVFELGLFHGDPHAGNLMLLEDGAIGLFDWGLYGELLESDRAHIAALLRAVMALDLEKLSQALLDMAEEEGKKIDQDKLTKELRRVAKMFAERQKAGEKASLQDLINECLEVAHKLNLRVPEGLVMMAKSLITIEGLAKGIDPDIRLGMVASPFLLKAAKPTWGDLFNLSRKAPQLVFKMLKDKA